MTNAATTNPSSNRRENILAAAIQLFYERGYQATGVDDIGAAAGVSGPSIYYHFASKQQILEEALIEFGQREIGRRQTILIDGGAEQALQRVIEQEIDAFLEMPALSVVGLRERRHLTPGMLKLVDAAERQHRRMLVELLRRVRPQLTAESAETVVHCVQRMLLSVTEFEPTVAGDDLSSLLKRMAMAALLS